MPHTTTSSAVESMEHVRRQVEATPYLHKAVPLPITVSVGIAELSDHMSGVDALLGASERALYRAKRGGRNHIEAASVETGASAEPDVVPVVVYQDSSARTSTAR